MKNNYVRYLLFTLILQILFVSGCKENTTGPKYLEITADGETLKPGDIIKIDDYPLFVMNFNGDYNFNNLLKAGNQKTPVKYYFHEQPAWGCTCFSASGENNDRIFGRNFDYYHHTSLVLFTSPSSAYSSISIVDLYYLGFSEESTVDQLKNSSVIKTASLFPFDGVNEKGVAIGMMAIPKADAPYSASKKSLNCLEVIRLVLDYAASTDEAISLLNKYNYDVDNPPVHFLISDRSGKSALVEYINKELKVIYNNEPFHVSTNFIVTGSKAPQETNCWRYNKTYKELKESNGNITTKNAMELLSSVSQDITMWSAVYNLNSVSLDIAVGRNYEKVYSLKAK